MTTKEPISREMTIDEILGKFPEKSQRIAQELTNAGLHCVGCQAATWETLEVGMMGHGFEEEAIEALLKRLNAIIEMEIDASTITLTETAAKKFKEILKADKKEGWGLRFGDKPGGCGGFEYILDFAEKALDDDEVFYSQGVEVFVNRKMLHRLMGCQIDYLEGLMGSGFKVTNPNVKGSCSCGNSQSY
ncbi:MAG: iron-sulfur cluster assembly accessory protein [Chlamydiales bacterium]|nr:iron-sulfur cluster assembly accessory protein [Chlamydiia bacterium]MCP5504472.1 iron-sulfur cluster assembly accessory protein [Chlamydiales bacterium]